MHYLGLFNYFRNHIPLISRLTAPLDKLRNSINVEQDWTAECQEHFDALKALLLQVPMLAFPDFSQTFCVATDASEVGIGAVLYQVQDESSITTTNSRNHRYISFLARSLKPTERKYSTPCRELLAIIFALNKFHSYLWGNPFMLFTDNRALTFLHTQSTLNIMMSTWLDILLSYTFTIIHRPGIINILPDHLSRLFPPTFRGEIKVSKLTLNNDNTSMETIPQVDLLNLRIPNIEDRPQLLHDKHLLGHFGAEAIVQALKDDGMYWKNVKKEAIEIVRQCQDCQRFNISQRGFHPLRSIHAELPGDHWAMDLAGPFPTSNNMNNYLLIVVDIATRFILLRVILDKQAITIAQQLLRLFCDFGFPKILQSNNGTEFVNTIVKSILDISRIDQRLITPYHPRANGVAERYVQTTIQAIRKQLQGVKADWDIYIPAIQFAINVKVAALHGSTPFSLMFGRQYNFLQNYDQVKSKPLSFDELKKRMDYLTTVVFPGISKKAKSTQKRMKEKFDNKMYTDNILFPDGSYVMITDVTRRSKLDPIYEGPFKVIRRTHGGSYVLQDNDNALLPRNYPPSALKLISQDPIYSGQFYKIQAILDHRGEGKEREYLVQWKNFDKSHNTWEPIRNFNDHMIIDQYWKRRGRSS